MLVLVALLVSTFVSSTYGLSMTCLAQSSFQKWGQVMERHVKPGVIDGMKTNTLDYVSIAKDPDFWGFIKDLEDAPTDGLDTEQFYALYMNAYNALAIRKVVENPCKPRTLFSWGKGVPIDSIWDVGNKMKLQVVWLMKAGKVGGKQLSLDNIENKLLRKPPAPIQLNPLLHACINCASLSCPDLLPRAYLPDGTLEDQMAESMREFLAADKGLQLDRQGKVLRLSKIFSWFSKDFEPDGMDKLGYLSQYMPADVASFVRDNKDLKVEYMPYSWKLNGSCAGLCS